MPRAARSPRVESKVHTPGSWIVWLGGGLFLAIGIYGVLYADRIAAEQVRFVQRFFGAFAVLAILALLPAVWKALRPTYVRHAAADELPDVPREPLALDWTMGNQQVIYELIQGDDGWEYRRRPSLWHNENAFLWIVGLAGFATCTALVTWGIHDRVPSLLVAAVISSFAVLFVGMPVLWLVLLVHRASSRLHVRLRIPTRGDVEFKGPLLTDPSDPSPRGSSPDPCSIQHLAIPTETIVAVQLCPWYDVRRGERDDIRHAVQGLLVLSTDAQHVYRRLPLLLTQNHAGAARLMQRTADVLQVPYLFHADAPGWKAEVQRQQTKKSKKRGHH